MVHIPYRGAGPALNDLLAGQVQCYFDQVASSLPHVQSGKLRALAVSWDKRLDVLPGVPTYRRAQPVFQQRSVLVRPGGARRHAAGRRAPAPGSRGPRGAGAGCAGQAGGPGPVRFGLEAGGVRHPDQERDRQDADADFRPAVPSDHAWTDGVLACASASWCGPARAARCATIIPMSPMIRTFAGTTPLVLDSPHSGVDYPDGLRPRLRTGGAAPGRGHARRKALRLRAGAGRRPGSRRCFRAATWTRTATPPKSTSTLLDERLARPGVRPIPRSWPRCAWARA